MQGTKVALDLVVMLDQVSHEFYNNSLSTVDVSACMAPNVHICLLWLLSGVRSAAGNRSRPSPGQARHPVWQYSLNILVVNLPVRPQLAACVEVGFSCVFFSWNTNDLARALEQSAKCLRLYAV